MKRNNSVINVQQRGFTLLEMIVVLVIVGLIAGMVGPSLFKQADKAKVQTAQTQVKMLRGALHTFKLDVGRLPTAEEGLKVLVSRPGDERSARFWQGPYLEGEVPLDPWNREYVYTTAASEFEQFSLYSLGADGLEGGSGDAEDVGYLPAQR